MDAIFWIATVLSFIGNTAFTASALFTDKKVAVGMQTSNHLLSSIAQLLQKAYSGMAQDAVCLLKNLILLFVPEKNKRVKLSINIACIALGVGLGIALNVLLSDSVWYGFLPVASSAILSTSILMGYLLNFSPFKQLVIMKSGLMINSVCWATYGIFIKLYPVTAFNCLTFVLAAAAIIRFAVKNKKAAQLQPEDGQTPTPSDGCDGQPEESGEDKV